MSRRYFPILLSMAAGCGSYLNVIAKVIITGNLILTELRLFLESYSVVSVIFVMIKYLILSMSFT